MKFRQPLTCTLSLFTLSTTVAAQTPTTPPTASDTALPAPSIASRGYYSLREGDDLRTTVTCDLYTLLLGGEVVVPTLNGNIKMNIKAGTQPDSRMRLRGKGLPHYKSEGAGDMIVTIKVVLPTLNAQQAELLKKIKAEER